MQVQLLNKTFGGTRYAWNAWVEVFNNKNITDKKYLTAREFKQDLQWMNEISSAALQQKERDFQVFKKQFFNKKRKKLLNRPVFKSKFDRQSYRLPNQKFDIDFNASRIRLEKIGKVRVVFDRSIPKHVKFVNATVSKTLGNEYYVSILVEENIVLKSKTLKEVGVDVGIKEFAVLSDNTVINNPHFFRENQSKLKRMQQHFFRKKKGSNSRRRCKADLARLHERTSRKRRHFLHELSSRIVSTYDVIAIEDLNVSGMLRNHKLAKSIQDVSWSEFFSYLKYKCEWYGKELLQVPRFYASSKTCSICGWKNADLKLKDRTFVCANCGQVSDRDFNASTNILNKAKSAGVDAELQTWRDCQTLAPCASADPCEVSRFL
jgi:putative transposase